MKTIYSALIFTITALAADAATVAINWSVSSNPSALLLDSNSNPLSAGSAATGDGTLVQLGYYDQAIITNPFRGNWVVLASTTMGDDGLEVSGRFSTTTILGGTPFPEPSAGTPLAIRFYDGTSVGTSTYFNAVGNTSGGWNFVTPSDPAPVMNIVIDKVSGIKFQSGDVFKTQIAIPEPSSLLLASVALSFSVLNRRRQKK